VIVLERLEAATPLLEGGHHAGEQVAKAMPVQESSEGQQTSATRNPLVGETDLDGFIRRFESNEVGHRLVTRCVGGLGWIFSTTPSLHRTVAALLLHGYR